MKVVRHRLVKADGTAYPFVRSPNMGGVVEPKYLIIHYTAGRTAAGAISALTNPQREVSAHLVIGRDGSITQLVPFNRIAWHAGQSRWEGLEGLNRYSLGIELDNAGKLTRHGQKWLAWFSHEYENAEVLEATHKNETEPAGWHIYTPEQLEATMAVSSLLVSRYGLLDLLGHEDIAPTRKVDPGPAFPMQSFRARVFGRVADEPIQYETSTTLNIRVGPGTEHEKLPQGPLPQGTRVEVLNSVRMWREVDVLDTINGDMDLQGWVHGRYLKRVT